MTASDDVFSRLEVEELRLHLDDETEWTTVYEFYDAWSPRVGNRLQRLLRTSSKLNDRVSELEIALAAAVKMLDVAEWSDEVSEQGDMPTLSKLRKVLRGSRERVEHARDEDRMIALARATGSAAVAAQALAAVRAALAGRTLGDRQREALRAQAELLTDDGPRAVKGFLRTLAELSTVEGLDRVLGEDAAALCKRHLVAALDETARRSR